jgi:oligopeptide transport system substrate-binding protein
MRTQLQIILLCLLFGHFFSCSNNPYPHETSIGKVFYTSFSSPPKNLDPQHTYTSTDLCYLRFCYEPLLGYHYLDQMKLIPCLAKSVPKEKVTRVDGKITEVRYTFNLQEGVKFIDDRCFDKTNGKGREMTAKDFLYAFHRVADKEVGCPISSQFVALKGFKEYKKKITAERNRLIKDFENKNKITFDKEKHYISGKGIYDTLGDMPGIEITSDYSFDMVMTERYPQILYWLAMRFVSAVPHEAVDFYNPTKQMTDFEPMNFNLHPVGTGSYKMLWKEFRKAQKVVMVKNENWWGIKTASPSTRFPEKPFNEEDTLKGYWTPERAGKPIAQLDRIEWYKEAETIPKFGKFLQGYYDSNYLPPEKIGEAMSGQTLSDKMLKDGVAVNRSVKMNIRYIGFNMQGDELGSPKKFKDPELEKNREKTLTRNRKLRQAMSLAVDTKEYIRNHMKGMGIAAQSPLPPGIFGYDKDYQNPHNYQNEESLVLARKLLKEAGYPNGIDPKTNEPLELTFTYSATDPSIDIKMKHFITCWGQIGIKVNADSNDYNNFQKKVYSENFQIFLWGWNADYPDPENFLFLLISSTSPTPNHALNQDPEFDFYFDKMKLLLNDESATWKDKKTGEQITMKKIDIIQKCIDIFAEKCPWVILYHDIDYELYHHWLKNIKSHPLITYPYDYYDLDVDERTKKRLEWNQAVIWPAFLMLFLLISFVTPIFRTYFRERN